MGMPAECSKCKKMFDFEEGLTKADMDRPVREVLFEQNASGYVLCESCGK